MTTRISPHDLNRVLQTLSPEAEEPYPQLAELTPEQLLRRRIDLSNQLKRLEEERKAIDSELQDFYSDAELRKGVKGPGGWIIQQRNRTSWTYNDAVKELVQRIQKDAQRNGQAEKLTTTFLTLSFERPKA